MQIFLGTREALLDTEPGERFLTVSDAEVLGRLSGVLEEFYSTLVVVHDPDDVDWTMPVVSVGGGNSNRVFQNVDISEYPEFRFDSNDHYTIVNRDGSQRSSSIEPALNQKSTSYAIVGRYSVRSANLTSDLIVIAGAYGPSTLRALVYLLEKKNLQEIFESAEEATSFQALIRVVHHEEGVYSAELSSVQALESLDKRLLVEAQPRVDVPRSTAEAAKRGLDSPQSTD